MSGSARFNRISNQLMPQGNNALMMAYTAQTATGGPDTLDLTFSQSSNKMDQIQAVFIDNSLGTETFVITPEFGTTIKCPAGWQGWFPIAAPFPSQLVFTGGGALVPLVFTNVPMPVGAWPALSPIGSSPLIWTSFSGITPPVANQQFQLFPADPTRKFVMFRSPANNTWFNPLGGLVTAGGVDCFTINGNQTFISTPGMPVVSAWTAIIGVASTAYSALSGN